MNKAKENAKTELGILGHVRIQTTLDLYVDEDLDEMIAAQEEFLDSAFLRPQVQALKISGAEFDKGCYERLSW